MHFDMTISLGNIISTIGLLVGMVAIYNKLRDRLTALEVKVEPVWKWFTGGAN